MSYLLALLAVVPLMLFSGYVFHILWAWFIAAPLGLPAISVPVAIGMMVIAGYVSPTASEPKDGWDLLAKQADRALEILIAWGLAGCVHQYV